MKSLKEAIKGIFDDTEHCMYLKIREEWEQQNILIDEQYSEITKQRNKIAKLKQEIELEKELKQECVDEGQKVIDEKNIVINKLELMNVELNNKLKEKESARRKLASKIGGYQARINKLEMQVEFLKTNRRSPNIEEIKDYELKRKRRLKNE